MVSSSPVPLTSPAPQQCLPLAQTPPEAPPYTQALALCLMRAESMSWGFARQSLTWPGASVCLHSHCHPAALPVPLHLLLGSAGGLAPVPGAHGGARRQCWPYALLLHAGLGCACLHHRYPTLVLGLTVLHPEVHLRATFYPPMSQAPHPNAAGQVLHRCPSGLTWPLRPPPEGWVPHADIRGPR